MERFSWWLLVRAVRWYASRYMDQFESFKFWTDYGPIYVTISRQSEWPDSFEILDAKGHLHPPTSATF